MLQGEGKVSLSLHSVAKDMSSIDAPMMCNSLSHGHMLQSVVAAAGRCWQELTVAEPQGVKVLDAALSGLAARLVIECPLCTCSACAAVRSAIAHVGQLTALLKWDRQTASAQVDNCRVRLCKSAMQQQTALGASFPGSLLRAIAAGRLTKRPPWSGPLSHAAVPAWATAQSICAVRWIKQVVHCALEEQRTVCSRAIRRVRVGDASVVGGAHTGGNLCEYRPCHGAVRPQWSGGRSQTL